MVSGRSIAQMMEMRGGKGNRGSDGSLSSLAKTVEISLLVASAASALVFWGLSVYVWFLHDGRMSAFLLFIVGLVMAGLAWYLYNNAKRTAALIVRNELRDDGYYTRIRNRKTGSERELLIPFTRMKEVLLGKTFRYRGNEDRNGDYLVGASIVMKWEDAGGHTQYAVFKEDNPSRLEGWLSVFRQNEVPLFVTGEHIGSISLKDYKRNYPAIEKRPMAPEAGFPIGHTENHKPASWKPAQTKTADPARAASVSRIVKAGYLILLLVNAIAGYLWLPEWSIEGGTFVETSWILAFFAANTALFILFGGYWRKKSGWYRPLLDSFLVFSALSVGLIIALAGSGRLSLYWNALVVDGVAFAAFLTGAYLFTRFFVSRWR